MQVELAPEDHRYRTSLIHRAREQMRAQGIFTPICSPVSSRDPGPGSVTAKKDGGGERPNQRHGILSQLDGRVVSHLHRAKNSMSKQQFFAILHPVPEDGVNSLCNFVRDDVIGDHFASPPAMAS